MTKSLNPKQKFENVRRFIDTLSREMGIDTPVVDCHDYGDPYIDAKTGRYMWRKARLDAMHYAIFFNERHIDRSTMLSLFRTAAHETVHALQAYHEEWDILEVEFLRETEAYELAHFYINDLLNECSKLGYPIESAVKLLVQTNEALRSLEKALRNQLKK